MIKPIAYHHPCENATGDGYIRPFQCKVKQGGCTCQRWCDKRNRYVATDCSGECSSYTAKK